MPNDTALADATNTDNAGGVDTSAAATGADTGSATPADQAAAQTPEQIAKAAADQAALDQAAADQVKADADKAKAEGAPEKYEFTLPEGVTLDPSVQAQFEATARELNMSQANAQKLVGSMGPKIAAAQAEAATRVRAEWSTLTKSDKEFGGEHLEANLAVAKTAVDKFGTPEFKTFLNDTGLGDHPEMIRMMYRAGKALAEDKPVAASVGARTDRATQAKTLYPSSN